MSCGPDCTECADCAEKAAHANSLLGVGAGEPPDSPPMSLPLMLGWTFVIGVAAGLFVHAITWNPRR